MAPRFGALLSQVLQYDKVEDGIPKLVKSAITALRSDEKLLGTSGLFRICADANLVAFISDLYDQGLDVVLSPSEPHVNANLLKKFLRDMSDPLLTYELYSLIIAAYGTLKLEENSVKLTNVLEYLPRANCQLLRYILEFLHQVAQHHESNRMDVMNLARVFGPLLLRSEGEVDKNTLGENEFAIEIVSILITDSGRIVPN
eukprot:CAMPEP_0201523994 /NCGR_PEP_ID=MMETSP0161_2-20130828/21046_1 /ASSEMBLY_ACC=CAM_ASM_000251 /TAXON_ID=180227 /ORGANISM="Neoparamoeba aestuarina, Strain SoJaBio B1-5/56/2" /LENGTH=200 /DNA_ID=CAMNT_0047923243 /DNA_START=599 /DNA_END=1198 /DNA_ORIENTATION=-